MDLRGLSDGCRVAPVVLGHRGSRLAVDVSELVTPVIDERSGLPFCPVKGVFESNSVFLGFGTPNVFLMVPRAADDNWDKFTAFMFFRQRSYVAERMDRMQVGVYFELRDLPEKALEALREEMQLQKGRRTSSCANANAHVLTAAGFTSGGKSLAGIYRPSQLAAVIWEQGLEYDDTPVSLRYIQAGHEIGDHFRAVWLKEFTSLCRSLKKKFIKHDNSTSPAPRFEEPQRASMSVKRWEDSTKLATVGISRPSWLGVWLGFLLGQRPIFTFDLGSSLDVAGLNTSLPPFPGELDRVTKFKKNVLFARRPVEFMRRKIMRSVDKYPDVPQRAIVEMLHRSTSHNREDAFIYNLVITNQSIQIARLRNNNGRDNRFVNWIMAKHLVISGYNADVRFAGEMWCCKNEGDYVTFLSDNSGTFKPTEAMLKAAATFLSTLFDVEVRIVTER